MIEPIEAGYPILFRASESTELGSYLKQHTSVVLVGMKRVGISNFLRFFLNHPQVPQTYIKNGQHLFVAIDLNDLVDRNLYPFWRLTLKRLVDAVQTAQVSTELKATAQRLFADSIQLQDLFLTIENVREICKLVVSEKIALSLFFIRFDRLQDSFTGEFFANLQGLRDAVGPKLCFVFTSFRPLQDLAPAMISQVDLAVFARTMYLLPATPTDISVILNTLLKRYDLSLPAVLAQAVIELSGGHVQYLQVSLIKLKNELTHLPFTSKQLKEWLVADEEIFRLSEEIYASLRQVEQQVLKEYARRSNQSSDAVKGTEATQSSGPENSYLLNTGLVRTAELVKTVDLVKTQPATAAPKQTSVFFNEIFAHHLQRLLGSKEAPPVVELTKKEHQLFELLHTHQNELLERDDIIEAVWPDESEMGVSDWALDRLIARLRQKLKAQKSPWVIVTVVARGYKLVRV